MTQIDIADNRYYQILNTNNILSFLQQSLEQFHPQTQPLFPTITSYPKNIFNQTILSSSNKLIVKQFSNNDTNNNIQLFYFQLLRLSYQVYPKDCEYRRFIVAFRRLVFDPNFVIVVQNGCQNSDYLFKKYFVQFLDILDKSSTDISIQNLINKYQIIDTVFVKIIRSLLECKGNERVETGKVFEFFEKMLGLKIKNSNNGKQYVFEDSKMVCYEEEDGVLFLGYIKQERIECDEVCYILPKVKSIPDGDDNIIDTIPVISQTAVTKKTNQQMPKVVQQFISNLAPQPNQNLSTNPEVPQIITYQLKNSNQNNNTHFYPNLTPQLNNNTINQHSLQPIIGSTNNVGFSEVQQIAYTPILPGQVGTILNNNIGNLIYQQPIIQNNNQNIPNLPHSNNFCQQSQNHQYPVQYYPSTNITPSNNFTTTIPSNQQHYNPNNNNPSQYQTNHQINFNNSINNINSFPHQQY